MYLRSVKKFSESRLLEIEAFIFGEYEKTYTLTAERTPLRSVKKRIEHEFKLIRSDDSFTAIVDPDTGDYLLIKVAPGKRVPNTENILRIHNGQPLHRNVTATLGRPITSPTMHLCYDIHRNVAPEEVYIVPTDDLNYIIITLRRMARKEDENRKYTSQTHGEFAIIKRTS